MNTQREELAREIFIADNSGQPREHSLKDWAAYNIATAETYAHNIADGLIAAGWTKPRTITTTEELKGSHAGTLLREPDGDVWSIDGSTDRLFLIYDGADTTYDDHELILPATVLWEPAPSA